MQRLTSLAAIGGAVLLSACSQPHGMAGGQGLQAGYGQGPMVTGPGWHMGPGMMGPGSAMMGPGGAMMGPSGGIWGLERLDLSAQQRSQIARIQDDAMRQQQALMTQMQAQMGPGTWDDKEQRRHYDAMSALHKQMFEIHLATRQRLLEVLTAAQREQLKPGAPTR